MDQQLRHAPSVATQIRGGIGNQLFIYAMVRRLSLASGVPLYLETKSGFDGDFFCRSYGLDVFDIAGRQITAERRPKWSRRATIVANALLPFSRRWYFRESNGSFESRYLDLKVTHPIHLEGYWQDERYFADIRTQLKSDLTFVKPHREANLALAAEMRKSESVAVHVRRLLGIPTRSHHPAVFFKSLPPEYYRAAIQRMKERLQEPRFYLFCDDPELTAIPGVEEDVKRVENTGEDGQYEDLYLMSQCHHYVLANSTFSWWGAWLGRTHDSLVISPVMQQWAQLVRIPDEWAAFEWRRGF